MQKPLIASFLRWGGGHTRQNRVSKKLLVHFHLFYIDQTDFFISKLQNISGINFDLYVTMISKNSEAAQKILSFKPDAKIIIVPNTGYDVYPFIYVLQNINIDNYDYVLKIHTKHNIKDRNKILKPLLWSKNNFRKLLNKMINNENIGIIGHKVQQIYGGSPEENEVLNPLLETLGIPAHKYHHFIPGTMFLIRTELLKFLLQIEFRQEDFKSYEGCRTGDYGTLAHTLERVFGIITEYNGFIIADMKHPVERFLNKLIITRNLPEYKLINILGIKLKIKR